jgi:hypothetical protein
MSQQSTENHRAEMHTFARQVNQRPLGEILLEKEKEKR